MKTEVKLELQAYLDQELSPAEARQIAALIEKDAEAQGLFAELRATKEILAGNELEARVPETPEFYWSRIEQRIRAEEAAAARAKSPAPYWFSRIFAPMAGIAAVALFLFSHGAANKSAAPTVAAVHEIETPGDDAGGGFTYRSDKAGITIVWISSGKQ